MATVREIDAFATELAPTCLSEEWDNDGVMLCGNPDGIVTRAVVCLEVGIDVVKYAEKIGANLIVTHHPFIFRPMKNVKGEKYSELQILIKNNISVLSYHTRYDKAKDGVNDVLAETLGLSNISSNGGFLRVGELDCEMTGEDFAEYLRTKLGCGIMKAYFDKDTKIKKVAVCGGAGKEFLSQVQGLADAYVSADFSHESFREARAYGVAVFDAGHYFTENPAAKKLKELLEKNFTDVNFEFYDVKSPFFTI